VKIVEREKNNTMAKKVWISFPLTASCDTSDASVVTFLKGGQKKELEVEVAAFVTKWLIARDVPFGIAFESCGVDRAVVIESLPKRLQKILGATAPAITDTAVADPGEVPSGAEAAPVEQVPVVAAATSVEDTGAVETLPAADEVAAEPPVSDRGVA
jgi:hypothetical protein